jgi:hypothetical protein
VKSTGRVEGSFFKRIVIEEGILCRGGRKKGKKVIKEGVHQARHLGKFITKGKKKEGISIYILYI